MIEVTDEMVDAAALAFTEKPTEATYVVARRMLNAASKLYEQSKPHLVTQDTMTNCVHVLPMDFIKDLSNGTQNLKHLSEKESDAIVRCLANTVVDLSKPKPESKPVGYVKTVGGYPDESEHKIEWAVKYKELKYGQPLYAAPPTREPLSEQYIVDLIDAMQTACGERLIDFARAIEQSHGIN